MVVQAAQGLLDALRSAQPQSLGAILSAVRESDATAELLKLAASLAPAEEREVGWELLGQICRAASLQSLPPVDVGTFVKTVQTTLRVTLWKYSHELMCTEGTLNAAALRAAEAVAESWPAACPRFATIVVDIGKMLALAPDLAVRRACVGLLCTLSCSADLREPLLRAGVLPHLRGVLEPETPSLRPLSAAVALANLVGSSEAEPSEAIVGTELAPMLIEKLSGGFRATMRASQRPGPTSASEQESDEVGVRPLTMVRLLPPVCLAGRA